MLYDVADNQGLLQLGSEQREKSEQWAHSRALPAGHASSDFIDFLTELVGNTKWAREIHIVLDNLSAYRTHAAQEFLATHP